MRFLNLSPWAIISLVHAWICVVFLLAYFIFWSFYFLSPCNIEWPQKQPSLGYRNILYPISSVLKRLLQCNWRRFKTMICWWLVASIHLIRPLLISPPCKRIACFTSLALLLLIISSLPLLHFFINIFMAWYIDLHNETTFGTIKRVLGKTTGGMLVYQEKKRLGMMRFLCYFFVWVIYFFLPCLSPLHRTGLFVCRSLLSTVHLRLGQP